MTEDLADFLRDQDIKVEYLHSDIDAIERVEILEIYAQAPSMFWSE